MGILVDYFMADDDTSAAAALTPRGLPGRETVDGQKMVPVVAMANAESFLTGRSYDDVVGSSRSCSLVAEDASGEAWVMTLTDQFRDALAAADEARLRDVAVQLSQTEECRIERRTPDHLTDLLVSLSGLVSGAKPGQRLYAEVRM